jgi:predicted acetyltransferase
MIVLNFVIHLAIVSSLYNQYRMMNNSPFLDRPHQRYKDSYLAAAREFEAEGMFPPWGFDVMTAHFDEFIETVQARATDPMPGYVPQTDYWLIVAEQYVGSASIRHHLTDALLKYGGHIGYRIRPTYRRQGYGTLQCKLAIEKAHELGIQRILITCDDDNLGSSKIIEANGGKLWDKVDNGRASLTRRYWVEP